MHKRIQSNLDQLEREIANLAAEGTWVKDHFTWMRIWLDDPDATFRSIAREEGVSKSTVASRLKKLLPILRLRIAENADIFELDELEGQENDNGDTPVYDKLMQYLEHGELDIINQNVDQLYDSLEVSESYHEYEPFEPFDEDEADDHEIQSDQFNRYEETKASARADAFYTGIVSENSIQIIAQDGRQITVSRENKNFEAIKQGLIERVEFSVIEDMIDTGKKVVQRLEGIEYRHGKLWYGDIEVSSTMVPRIMQSDLIESTGYTEALKKFFEKLIDNPYREVVDQLYRFLETNKLPLTKDGNFLTYKRVNDNYTDCHSSTFDNSVGAEPEMKRIQVVRDPSQTCSPGFHVCSYGYLDHFRGAKIMVCEVDPTNVVSVPNDYNGTKMRVCKYKVIGEIGNGWEHSDMETFYHNGE